MGFFLIFNLSVPIILRLFFSKPCSFYARSIGFLEDVFVVLEVFLLNFISLELAAIAGCLVQLALTLDCFLFRKMQLRLTFAHFAHLHHLKSLYPSAKALGLGRVTVAVSLIGIAHLMGYFFYQQPTQLEGICALAVLIFAPIVGACMPQSLAYALDNMFFAEQKKAFSKKLKEAPPIFSSNPFSGPLKCELKLEEKPHVMLIFLESFGAKAVGKTTTPHFDRLSQEGVFFSNFYSNGTLTYRGLLAGLFGVVPGNTTQGLLPYVDLPFIGIPQLMKKAGYTNAFFHNGSLAYDKQWDFLEKHFDVIADRHAIEDSPDTSLWGAPDEDLMRYTVQWLEKQRQPAFLTLFTITNHHPWIVPPHHQPPIFEGALNSPKQRFLQTVHYTDAALGLLINLLKEKKQKTVLLIVGDHGQPMGEHGGNFYNSRFLYEENIRVPLLIWGEGITPQLIDDLGSHVDLLPTLMDFLQIKDFPCGHGTSLLRQNEKIVMLQNPYSEGFLGCRKGPWKCIKNQQTLEVELYDLIVDPEEKNNIAPDNPEIAKELRLRAENYASYLDHYYRGQKSSPANSRYKFDLNFSGSMITDQELMDLQAPQLQRLNLSDCLVITDKGIRAILLHCPDLEELNLTGVMDVTGEAFINSTKLRKLEISAAQISDQGIERITKCCPHLSELSINGQNVTDHGIKAIGPHLTRFKIIGADHISDEAMIAFLKNNRHLGRFVIEGCRKLTDRTLEALMHHPIEQLWLIDAPRITDEGVAYLSMLPLKSLKLEGCSIRDW